MTSRAPYSLQRTSCRVASSTCRAGHMSASIADGQAARPGHERKNRGRVGESWADGAAELAQLVELPADEDPLVTSFAAGVIRVEQGRKVIAAQDPREGQNGSGINGEYKDVCEGK